MIILLLHNQFNSFIYLYIYMNFKLSSQHILQITLLIAVVLLAIYLVKPTLEGSNKFIDCMKNSKATTWQ